MFSHLALISVELANSFWPRKLSAAPIGFSFQCETLFKALVEHFIPRLQVVDEKETVACSYSRYSCSFGSRAVSSSMTASSSRWLRSRGIAD